MAISSWTTALLAVWAAIGPFAGIAYGHRLATAWQRRQWALDSKKQEYKELLGTLTRDALCILHDSGHLGFGLTVTTGEQECKAYEADIEARGVIQDRLFIATVLQKEKILERWQLLVALPDGAEFLNAWRDLHTALLDIAHKDLGIGISRG